jgi:hypothetical protein
MARERDGAIEMMGRIYLLMVALFIEEAKVPTMVLLNGEAQTVKPDDLTGDFQIFAADQASTPISEAIREQRLLQNAQLLQALGVPNQKILEEIVRTMGLPEDFLETAPPAAAPEQGGAGIPGVANPEGPPTAQDLINTPSPQNVSDMLLGGGVGFTQ